MISRAEITTLGSLFGYDPALIKAFIDVEGSGSGFDKYTGKIKIQFEPHHFKKHTGIKIDNGVEGQEQEYKAFNEAFKISPTKAMLCTSWGIMQVMGFNFKASGYNSVDEMVDDFKVGEYQQVKGALTFIKNTNRLHVAFRKLDFTGLAIGYNGPRYYLNNYDRKLRDRYHATRKLWRMDV